MKTLEQKVHDPIQKSAILDLVFSDRSDLVLFELEVVKVHIC